MLKEESYNLYIQNKKHWSYSSVVFCAIWLASVDSKADFFIAHSRLINQWPLWLIRWLNEGD